MHNKIEKMENSKSGLKETTLLQLSKKDSSLSDLASGLEDTVDTPIEINDSSDDKSPKKKADKDEKSKKKKTKKEKIIEK